MTNELVVDSNPIDRSLLLKFQDEFCKLPNVVFGDSELCPLKHSFAPGVYVREIFIPKGVLIVGKIHKHDHPNFLLQGKVLVITEEGKRILTAPMSMISKAGTKRIVVALEDTVWTTVHVTNETDLEKIEDHVIAKTYEDLDNFLGIINQNKIEYNKEVSL